jgi:AraC-like DNA-binding protein
MGHSTTPAQPGVTVVDITDLTAANAGMAVIEQVGMPLLSTPLRARRVIVRLRSAIVVYHSTNLPVRTRTRVHDGLMAYSTFGPRAAGTVEGLEVRPGMLLVVEPETEAGFVVHPGYESVVMLVRPDDVQAHLTARQRAGEFRWPRGVEILRTDPAQARALFRWGKRLAVAASKKSAMFEEGRPEREAVQVELLEVLLTAMRSADKLEPTATERTRQGYSRIVKIAEDHARSRAGERLHLSELCQAADVSERTLEYAFKVVTGLSPMAYLVRLRLHWVHATLLAAEPGSTLISTEALKWGFWHFGEFSRAYKQCFGEPPSRTLRREPDSTTAIPAQSRSTPA